MHGRRTLTIPGPTRVIISRTPFRVSLVGGGSDIPDYYRKAPGSVVGMAINRYMYVTVNKRFDDSIRVSYTKTEIVPSVNQLQHALIREAIRLVGITTGIEITTIADLPAGIGLGSSSTVTVGVLNALAAYAGRFMSAEELAAAACKIEIDILGRPIGKQDQYLASYGGLRHVRFNPNESVEVNPIICPSSVQEGLVSRLMLFYTGMRRSADSVLSQAQRRIRSNGHVASSVEQLVWLADELRAQLIRGHTDRIGPVLARAWQLKKQMGSRVTNDLLDRYYRKALSAGSEGGKVLGAGGGGCILLSVPPRARRRVRVAMRAAGLREVPFCIEPEGSKIIYVGG